MTWRCELVSVTDVLFDAGVLPWGAAPLLAHFEVDLNDLTDMPAYLALPRIAMALEALETQPEAYRRYASEEKLKEAFSFLQKLREGCIHFPLTVIRYI